jgi:hypothetical protein
MIERIPFLAVSPEEYRAGFKAAFGDDAPPTPWQNLSVHQKAELKNAIEATTKRRALVRTEHIGTKSDKVTAVCQAKTILADYALNLRPEHPSRPPDKLTVEQMARYLAHQALSLAVAQFNTRLERSGCPLDSAPE